MSRAALFSTIVLPPARLCTSALRKEGFRRNSGDIPIGSPDSEMVSVREQKSSGSELSCPRIQASAVSSLCGSHRSSWSQQAKKSASAGSFEIRARKFSAKPPRGPSQVLKAPFFHRPCQSERIASVSSVEPSSEARMSIEGCVCAASERSCSSRKAAPFRVAIHIATLPEVWLDNACASCLLKNEAKLSLEHDPEKWEPVFRKYHAFKWPEASRSNSICRTAGSSRASIWPRMLAILAGTSTANPFARLPRRIFGCDVGATPAGS